MTELTADYKALSEYRPKHKVRFVTAASLFDGHDASINIMRRILQSFGCEVIHLGHNRSVDDVVTAALQEDVQGICVSSYQGGHVEYFKYMAQLLKERGGAHIKVFGDDYDTRDGTCVRDYVHVTDLADAHVRALDLLATTPPGMTPYNLGNGQGFTVREIIAAAERVTGLKVPVVTAARRAGDPAALVGDAARARSVLGWQPQHADIDAILGTAWRWLQQRATAAATQHAVAVSAQTAGAH